VGSGKVNFGNCQRRTYWDWLLFLLPTRKYQCSDIITELWIVLNFCVKMLKCWNVVNAHHYSNIMITSYYYQPHLCHRYWWIILCSKLSHKQIETMPVIYFWKFFFYITEINISALILSFWLFCLARSLFVLITPYLVTLTHIQETCSSNLHKFFLHLILKQVHSGSFTRKTFTFVWNRAAFYLVQESFTWKQVFHRKAFRCASFLCKSNCSSSFLIQVS